MEHTKIQLKNSPKCMTHPEGYGIESVGISNVCRISNLHEIFIFVLLLARPHDVPLR